MSKFTHIGPSKVTVTTTTHYIEYKYEDDWDNANTISGSTDDS